jgi:hypothetical protein
MTDVADAQAADDGVREIDLSLVSTVAAAVVVGVGLVLTARAGALALLIAIAAVQALLAAAWVFGASVPGRKGALVLAAMAAAAADVTVSVWPHGRLGTLLAVLGLALPVMFVHQLTRGAARVQVVASMSAVALLILGEVSLPALLQLRHEFSADALGGRVSAAVAAALAGALVVGCFVDMIMPAPRFDPAVPRGLLALVASAGLGGSLGYLMLRRQDEFEAGRSVFVGAALGALAGLLAIATAFVLYSVPEPAGRIGRRLRPALSVVLPIGLLAPVAFLLCLAIRS